MVNWTVSRVEMRLIEKIAKRAVALAASMEFDLEREQIEMDVTACHANGNPLDLEKLLAANDGDFGHDVFGIRKHIDRTTGQLRDCFVPRLSF